MKTSQTNVFKISIHVIIIIIIIEFMLIARNRKERNKYMTGRGGVVDERLKETESKWREFL